MSEEVSKTHHNWALRR